MALRHFLLSAAGGGLLAGVALALVFALAGRPFGAFEWMAVPVLCGLCFGFTGFTTYYRWSVEQSRLARQALTQLAEGDLTRLPESDGVTGGALPRLVHALRRTLGQARRGAEGLHRGSTEMSDKARLAATALHKQEHLTSRAVASMGGLADVLVNADGQLAEVERVAVEAAQELTRMSSETEATGQALVALNQAAQKSSTLVRAMSTNLGDITQSSEALVRFASEAESFVAVTANGIESVRRQAAETGRLAEEVVSTAAKGEALVQDSVAGMYRIEESVKRVAELVESLGGRSMEIGRIVDVIQEIADQTSLLSLNAAIIAAQAGESGRAFGVVAEAIRGLAERTARSTREIGALVKGVRDGVQTAVLLVSEGREQAALGVAQGDRASEALKEIRAITLSALVAVETTTAEAARLEEQGRQVVSTSRRVADAVADVTRAAGSQAVFGRDLVKQSLDVATGANRASERNDSLLHAERVLGESVGRLGSATQELRTTHAALMQKQRQVRDELSRVGHEVASSVLQVDNFSQQGERVEREASELIVELARIQLPHPRPGGLLRVGTPPWVTAELESGGLEPAFCLEASLQDVSRLLHCGLVRREGAECVPDLAERFEVDDAGLRFRFHLRKNLSFHDGAHLTAASVKERFERLLSPRGVAPSQALLLGLRGALEFRAGQVETVAGIQVLSPYMIELLLEWPDPGFLEVLSQPLLAIVRDDALDRPVGCGPFLPQSTGGSHARWTLVRNPSFHREELPYLDQVELRTVSSADEALRALASRELDLTTFTPLTDGVGAPPELQRLDVGSVLHELLYFNLREAPFQDVRVRRALRAGLDLQARHGPGQRDEGAPKPDLEQARRLLGEAQLASMKVTLLVLTGHDRTLGRLEGLFGPLVSAGLVALETVEVSARELWRRAQSERGVAFLTTFICESAHPGALLLGDGGTAALAAGYASPDLEKLRREVQAGAGPTRRGVLQRSAQELLERDCPYVSLGTAEGKAFAATAVQGLSQTRQAPLSPFTTLWLERAS